MCSGPVPAEQCDPDSLDTQHNAFVLGNFSDGDDSGPEGADIATVPSHAKVFPDARLFVALRLLPISRTVCAGKIGRREDADAC